MTPDQKRNLDRKLSEFDSFMELHKYANKNNIIFSNEEWEEYRDKFFNILNFKKNRNEEIIIDNIDLNGLILP